MRACAIPASVPLLAFLLGCLGAAEARPASPPGTPAASSVRIVVGFDGSCPHDPAGVKREGPRGFRIFPSWRSSPGISEEAVGRSTRLGFKLVNEGRVPAAADLWIDWQYDQAPPKDRPNFAGVEEFMSYRDFVVVGRPEGEKWRTVMADVTDSVAHVRLDVPPGETEVHWHPPYNYAQGERFVDGLRTHPLVKVEKIGESPERRNLWLLRITDASPRTKKNFLVRARVHAYESGGSYAMEGMVRWLLSDDAYAAAALREYVFHVIPMANPDGVHNGLGRLTAPRGTDLCYLSYQADPIGLPMKQVIDRIRPVAAIDLHNWQSKHVDGLLGLAPAIRERFVRFMPDQWDCGKEWSIRDPQPLAPTPPEKELFRNYCERNFQAVAVAFEFPWFGRTTQDMRATGRKALGSLLRALDPPGSRWK